VSDRELIEYIFEGRETPVSTDLQLWWRTCPRFKNFCHRYQDKIRKKIGEAKTDQDVQDRKSELKFAYLILLDDRFEVEYEKLSKGKERGPDFTVTFNGCTIFNAEIKRIREPELTVRFEKLIAEIEGEVQNVASKLEFGIVPGTARVNRDLLGRLESSKHDLVEYIRATIRRKEDKLTPGEQYEYDIPGFKNDITMFLANPAHRVAPGPTTHEGIMPVLYTAREYRKFGDIICEKLGQMLPNMINLLVVFCSSFTHEEIDLLKAVGSINELLGRGPEQFFARKGFAGKQDFLKQAKSLGGILFRDSYVPIPEPEDRNFLWCNEYADHRIPEAIGGYLRKMDG